VRKSLLEHALDVHDIDVGVSRSPSRGGTSGGDGGGRKQEQESTPGAGTGRDYAKNAEEGDKLEEEGGKLEESGGMGGTSSVSAVYFDLRNESYQQHLAKV
jgi:hypothetical protein